MNSGPVFCTIFDLSVMRKRKVGYLPYMVEFRVAIIELSYYAMRRSNVIVVLLDVV